MPCGVQNPEPYITVSTIDHSISNGSLYSFGEVMINTPLEVTFTVRNAGTEELVVATPITVSGSKFSIGSSLSDTNLESGDTATFSVVVDTTESGIYNGSVSLTSNDPEQNPFFYSLYVKVIAPNIEVWEDEVQIMTGDTSDYGVTRMGTSVCKTYIIKNTGDANLLLTTPVSLTPDGFCITESFTATEIIPGYSTTMTVMSYARSTGTFNALLTIESNDPDTPEFEINLESVVITPLIEVTEGGSPVEVNSLVDYGTNVIPSGILKTYTITNNGSAELHICDLLVPQGFVCIQDFGDTVVAVSGGTTEFSISFDPTTVGSYYEMVQFTTDDISKEHYFFFVQGVGTVPALQLFNGSERVLNGDETDFGSTYKGYESIETFTLKNVGTADLEVSGVVSANSGFIVGSSDTTISPGSSSVFQITMDTEELGNKLSTISFYTNDPNYPMFTFNAKGFVSGHPEILTRLDSSEIHFGEVIDFGTMNEGQLAEKVVLVYNEGEDASTALNCYDPVVPEGFTLTSQFPLNIPVSGVSPIVIQTGQTPGSHYGLLTFMNNDLDENPFVLTLRSVVVAVPIITVVDELSNDVTEATYATAFGSVDYGESKEVTYTVTNNGSATLLLSNPVLPEHYTFVTEFPTMVNAHSSALFTVKLTGNKVGQNDGTISFNTNDPYVPVIQFNVNANVLLHPRNSISNLVVWLDGKSIYKNGGDLLNQWNDLSGYNNHFVQFESSSFMPVYQENAVIFDGVDDFLLSNYRVSGGDKTFIMRIKFHEVKNADQLIGLYENGKNFFIGVEQTTNRFFAQYGDSPVLKNYPILQPGQTYTLILRGTNTIVDAFVDGYRIMTVPGQFPVMSVQNFLLGCVNNAHYAKASLNAVIIYNRSLTDAECVNVHRYLVDRFSES